MADPQYPFPSKVHVVSSVTLKLNDSNYLLWKTQFESLLYSQKLIGFVNGGVVPPEPTQVIENGGVVTTVPNPVYESWFCSDQLVRSWLFGTLSEEVLGSVHNLSTSREIWLSLAENFNKSSLSREFSLRRNLQLIAKKGRTLAEYSREFKALCDALSSIGKPVDESMKIFGYLNGLSREYDPVTTVIQNTLSKLPPPTFNDVIAEVQAYDSKLKSYDETAAISTHQAFQMQQTGFSHNPPQYNPNYRGRGGRGNQQRGRGGYSSRGRGFVQHQSQSGGSTNRPICQICGRVGHTAVKCYNRFDNSYNGAANTQAFSSLQVADPNGKDWFPDSGASAHVTASTTNLQSAEAYNGNDTVMVADGTYLPITHVGSVTISNNSEGSVKGTTS